MPKYHIEGWIQFLVKVQINEDHDSDDDPDTIVDDIINDVDFYDAEIIENDYMDEKLTITEIKEPGEDVKMRRMGMPELPLVF